MKRNAQLSKTQVSTAGVSQKRAHTDTHSNSFLLSAVIGRFKTFKLQFLRITTQRAISEIRCQSNVHLEKSG